MLSAAGYRVALAARDAGKLDGLVRETGAQAFACDATDAGPVLSLFTAVEAALGAPEVVIYNASGRARGALVSLDPAEVARSLAVTSFGGFLVGQAAARLKLERGAGARVGAARDPCRARGDRRRDPERGACGSAGCAGQPARSGRDRGGPYAADRAAPQRVDARDRRPELDRAVLIRLRRTSVLTPSWEHRASDRAGPAGSQRSCPDVNRNRAGSIPGRSFPRCARRRRRDRCRSHPDDREGVPRRPVPSTGRAVPRP